MDWQIFYFFNRLSGKNIFLDCLTIFFAQYSGYFLLLILVFLLLKKYKKYKNLVFVSLGSALVSRFLFTELIRHLYFRSRPFVENSVNLLIYHKPTASFPSGHTSFYFALSTVVYLYNKKLGTFFFLVSFLMGISRIYCGLHWPSDILVGAAIGVLVGWLFVELFKKIKKIK